MITQILSKVGILFILIFTGGLARHKKILTKESTRALSQLVLVITLPFLYFHSLATEFTTALFKAIWILPVSAACMLLLGYAISKIFSRFVSLKAQEKATFIYASTFTNCGFLAIPLASALYGPEGVIRVVFFNFGFSLLLWTMGIRILSRGRENTPSSSAHILPSFKNLLNSGIIGLLAGITIGLTAVKIPNFLMDSAKLLGSATIPLALLVVGSMMSKGNMDKLRNYKRPIALIALCRLIVVPATALLVTGFFGSLTPLIRAIIVLQSAMPTASTTPIFASKFGGDAQFASAVVFATTAISVITIPFFISLV